MERSKNVQSRRIISWPLEMLLRVLGIWPDVSYSLYRKVFWLTLIIINTIPQILFLIYRTVSSTIFLYAFAVTLTMNMKFIKIAVLWYNQRRFNEMWGTMSMNWKRNGDYKSVIDTTDKKHMLHHVPNFIVAFNMLSVIMTSLGNLSAGINQDGASNGTRSYVMPIHLPFDNIRKSVYLIIIFQQLFYLWIITATSAVINSVLVTLMLYLGNQIDIICTCLTKMPPKDDDNKANAIMIKEIIKKHQSVITFSENVEALYTYIALILVVLNTLITCGLAFVLVKAIGSPDFVRTVRKNFLFFCSINIETFVFCFSGEYLSTKSKGIGEAAFNSPWYRSKFHSRAVLFMIMRSQNQLTITMGKIMDLSLERFSTILKTSMSYLSVLLAMY